MSSLVSHAQLLFLAREKQLLHPKVKSGTCYVPMFWECCRVSEFMGAKFSGIGAEIVREEQILHGLRGPCGLIVSAFYLWFFVKRMLFLKLRQYHLCSECIWGGRVQTGWLKRRKARLEAPFPQCMCWSSLGVQPIFSNCVPRTTGERSSRAAVVVPTEVSFSFISFLRCHLWPLSELGTALPPWGGLPAKKA